MPFSSGWAHEGEDHGAPVAVSVVGSGEMLLATSGGGAVFEAVLKYPPFAPGETVTVNLYLVSIDSNRPIVDATVNASLSEGDQSTAVAFSPKPGGPVGAYSATVAPKSAAPMSWLFDITAGSESDLIGVTGFQASTPLAGMAAGQATAPHQSPPLPRALALWAGVGVLMLGIAFAAGRATAPKRASV
jgi:hypothetical protein